MVQVLNLQGTLPILSSPILSNFTSLDCLTLMGTPMDIIQYITFIPKNLRILIIILDVKVLNSLHIYNNDPNLLNSIIPDPTQRVQCIRIVCNKMVLLTRLNTLLRRQKRRSITNLGHLLNTIFKRFYFNLKAIELSKIDFIIIFQHPIYCKDFPKLGIVLLDGVSGNSLDAWRHVVQNHYIILVNDTLSGGLYTIYPSGIGFWTTTNTSRHIANIRKNMGFI
ncbi:hypothetical protein CAAN1_01S08152 [[Candida] anglica]|uniref:Uncharacterized protein n=1 Tax=[Candida] anglica TaxID=148631 RepID=A0ABP0EMS5_9ASCO